MGFSLSKVTEFFGLAEEGEVVEEFAPKPAQPKKVKSQPEKEKRVSTQSTTYRPQTSQARPVQQSVKSPAQTTRPVAKQRVQTKAAVQQSVNRVQPAIEKKVAAQPEKIVTMQKSAVKPTPVAPMREAQAVKQPNRTARRKISIVEPKMYSEAMAIARKLESGEAVLVNFQSIDEMKARRIVDFLTGVVFVSEGDIKRVGNEMFICTPPNVEIDSSTLRSLQEEDIFGLGM